MRAFAGERRQPDGASHGRLARRWLIGFVLLFGVITLWALATPRFAAPDEPAQAIKAAATVRGELVGRHPSSEPPAVIRFVVPKTIARGTDPICFAFKPSVSAACAPAWRAYRGAVQADSYVGRYPPLYYAVIGMPSLFTSGTAVLLWMRVVSAAAAAAFLAAGFVAASLNRRPLFVVAGVVVAMTPMTLFLGGVVNPSGLEIASASCLWSSGLALLSGAAATHRRWLLGWSAVSAAVMVQMRGLSPLLLVIVLSTLALAAEPGRLRDLARRPRAWIAPSAVAVCGVFATLWIVLRHALLVKPVSAPIPPGVSDRSLLRMALTQVGLDGREPIGVFGWLDTKMPEWAYVVWYGAVVVLALVALRTRLARPLVAAGITTVVAIALPTLLAFSQARQLGIVGQGRYILPVAVGIPILLGQAASRSTWEHRWVPAGLLGGAVVIAAAQTSAFVQALHRYRTGVSAPIWTAHGRWSPPITWWVCIVLFAVLAAGLLAWWRNLVRSGR